MMVVKLYYSHISFLKSIKYLNIIININKNKNKIINFIIK
jgi:hypothetical protein